MEVNGSGLEGYVRNRLKYQKWYKISEMEKNVKYGKERKKRKGRGKGNCWKHIPENVKTIAL